MRVMTFGTLIFALGAMLVGCESSTVVSSADPAATSSGSSGRTRAMHHQHHADDAAQLVAVMHPTAGNSARGIVTFTQTGNGVHVVADITGLSPNGTHAIHVHQYGDARAADGTSAGGHYNPQGHDHGLPEQSHRHAGDLGNIVADYNGNARYEITVDNVTLDGKQNPIIGRGVIIHAKADDGGQPTGNAGARISIGVIGVAKP